MQLPPRNVAGSSSTAHLQPHLFTGAPLTRIYFAASIITYLIIGRKQHQDAASSISDSFQFDASRILSNNTEFYRYLTSKFVFGKSNGDFLIGGALLCYLMRRYEREMNTRQLFAFLFVWTLFFAVFCEFVLLHLLNHTLQQWEYQGPYCLVGALFFVFHKYAPRINPKLLSGLGLVFSEKAFYYLWVAQVACANGYKSLAPVLMGFVAGYLYFKVPSTIRQSVQVPIVICNLVSTWTIKWGLVPAAPQPFVPRLATASATIINNAMANTYNATSTTGLVDHNNNTHGGGSTRHRGRINNTAATTTANVQPDPAAVEQLIHMGFDQAAVEQVLRQCNNDVHRAADILIQQIASG